MAQCLNRVDHVVWLVHAENQEGHVEKLSKLFRTKFDGPLVRPEFGARFSVSWEAGLEVFAPWGDSDYAAMWRQRLEQKGEGVLSVVVGVPDIEEASEHAKQLGYPVSPIIGLSGDEPWKHKLESFREAIIGDVLGTRLGYGEIRYAAGIIESK